VASANGTTELAVRLESPATPFVATALLHDGADIVARDSAWPEPFRFHDLGDAELTACREGSAWWLSVRRPLKGLWLSGPGLRFEDNFIDLVPGMQLRVGFQGDASARVTAVALANAARHLG